MSNITSLGIGSGIDINQLVSDLVGSQKDPLESRMTYKETIYEAKISGYGALKSSLSIFEGSISKLKTASSLQPKNATSNNEDLMTASANRLADPGQYQISVEQTAQAHSLATTTFDSMSDAVGKGSLTFSFGATDYDAGTDVYTGFTVNADESAHTITIDDTNNSLTGIRDEINKSDMGVTASIVNVGEGYRLVLTSPPGANNSMEITVNDDDTFDADNSGLSQFAFNGDATQMEQTLIAQDAIVKVNGVQVNSDSNTIDGVISGVTLNIKNSSPGEIFGLNISNDKIAVEGLVNEFVTAYNGLSTTLYTLSHFDEEKGEEGLLQGDAVVRTLQSQLRSILGTQLSGTGDNISSLADMGITTTTSARVDVEGKMIPAGTLKIDASLLTSAISDHFDEVSSVFAINGYTDNEELAYAGSNLETKSGEYAINITQSATRAILNGLGNLPADMAANPVVIDSNNDTFKIRVNDTLSGEININVGSYTSGNSLAEEIQSQINSDSLLGDAGRHVSVTYDSDNNRFQMYSETYGSSSSISMVQAESNLITDLGLEIAEGDDGFDVAGTIGGFAASGNGKTLSGTSGDVRGMKVLVDSSQSGLLGKLNFSRGLSESFSKLTTSYNRNLQGIVDSKINGVKDSLSLLADERIRLVNRMESFEQRLLSRFIAMDAKVSSFTNIGNFLTQQLESLPGVQQNKK